MRGKWDNQDSDFWLALEKYVIVYGYVRVMVFNATSINISAISWRSVLLVDETGVPGENHRPAVNQWQTLLHNIVSRTPRLSLIWTHNDSGGRHWLHR